MSMKKAVFVESLSFKDGHLTMLGEHQAREFVHDANYILEGKKIKIVCAHDDESLLSAEAIQNELNQKGHKVLTEQIEGNHTFDHQDCRTDENALAATIQEMSFSTDVIIVVSDSQNMRDKIEKDITNKCILFVLESKRKKTVNGCNWTFTYEPEVLLQHSRYIRTLSRMM